MTDSPAEKELDKPPEPEEATEEAAKAEEAMAGCACRVPAEPTKKPDKDNAEAVEVPALAALVGDGAKIASPIVDTLGSSLLVPPLLDALRSATGQAPKVGWPPKEGASTKIVDGRPVVETITRDDKENYVISTRTISLLGSNETAVVKDQSGRTLEERSRQSGLDSNERTKSVVYNPETGAKVSFSLEQKNKDGTGSLTTVTYGSDGTAHITVGDIHAKLTRGDDNNEHRYKPKAQPPKPYKFSAAEIDAFAAQFDDKGDVAAGRKFLSDMGAGEPAIAMAVFTKFGHGSNPKAGLAYIGKIGRDEPYEGAGNVRKPATPADLRRGVAVLTELGGGDMTMGGFVEGQNRFMRLGGYQVRAAFDSALLIGQGSIDKGIDRIGRLGTATGNGGTWVRDHIAGLENIEWTKGRDVGGQQGIELLKILGDGDVDKGIASLSFLGGGNVRKGIYRLGGFGDYRQAATTFREVLGAVLDGKPATTEVAKKVLERLGGDHKDVKRALEQFLKFSAGGELAEKDQPKVGDRLDIDLTVGARLFAEIGGGSCLKSCDVCAKTGQSYDKVKTDTQAVADGIDVQLAIAPTPAEAVAAFKRLGEVKLPGTETLTYNPDLAADNFIGISARPTLGKDGQPLLDDAGRPIVQYDGREALVRYTRLGALTDGHGTGAAAGIDVSLRLTTRAERDPVTGRLVTTTDATRVLPALDEIGDRDRGQAIVNLERIRQGSKLDVVQLLQRAADDGITVTGAQKSAIDNIRNAADVPAGAVRTVALGLSNIISLADARPGRAQTFESGLRNLEQIDKHAPISANIAAVRAFSDDHQSFAGGRSNLERISETRPISANIESVKRLGNPDATDAPGAFHQGIRVLAQISTQTSTAIAQVQRFGADAAGIGSFERGIANLVSIDRNTATAVGQVRQFSADGSFAGGVKAILQVAPTVDAAVSVVARLSDSGRFADGALVVRGLSPNRDMAEGIRVLQDMSPDGTVAGAVRVLKLLSSDGSIRSAVTNLTTPISSKDDTGLQAVSAYAKAAGKTQFEAVQAVKALGLGSAAVGLAALRDLGRGDLIAGSIRLATVAGPGLETARAVATAGNGNLTFGLAQIEKHQSELRAENLAGAVRAVARQEHEELLRLWQRQAAMAGMRAPEPPALHVQSHTADPAVSDARAKEAFQFVSSIARTLAQPDRDLTGGRSAGSSSTQTNGPSTNAPAPGNPARQFIARLDHATKDGKPAPTRGTSVTRDAAVLDFIRALKFGGDTTQIAGTRPLLPGRPIAAAATIGIGTDTTGISRGFAPLVPGYVAFPGASSALPGKTSYVASVRGRKGKKHELPGVEIALAAVLLSGGVARMRFDQPIKPGDGLKRLKRAEELARLAAGQEAEPTAGDDETAVQTSRYQVLKRPTWLVRAGEDLLQLAAHLFHDQSLGWLIADLNIAASKQTIVDGKRLVELRVRQRLDLPVWQDIVEYKKAKPVTLDDANLVTIVVETAVNAELVQAALSTVIGVGLQPAFANTGAVAARMTRGRSKTARLSAKATESGQSDDHGPSASAPITEEGQVVLEPKYV